MFGAGRDIHPLLFLVAVVVVVDDVTGRDGIYQTWSITTPCRNRCHYGYTGWDCISIRMQPNGTIHGNGTQFFRINFFVTFVIIVVVVVMSIIFILIPLLAYYPRQHPANPLTFGTPSTILICKGLLEGTLVIIDIGKTWRLIGRRYCLPIYSPVDWIIDHGPPQWRQMSSYLISIPCNGLAFH